MKTLLLLFLLIPSVSFSDFFKEGQVKSKTEITLICVDGYLFAAARPINIAEGAKYYGEAVSIIQVFARYASSLSAPAKCEDKR